MAAAALPVLADDFAFDEHLPKNLQVKSYFHFTPIAVARCAAKLLAPHAGMRVLDVGAGAGKFCLVAADEVPGARFVGVEFRGHLVQVASELARELQLGNVEFVHADAFELDWSVYDAFYFFNPFGEQLFDAVFLLDHTIDFDPVNFATYVAAVQERLAQARVGTRVVTYHGFGSEPPAGYELAARHAVEAESVELWIKVA